MNLCVKVNDRWNKNVSLMCDYGIKDKIGKNMEKKSWREIGEKKIKVKEKKSRKVIFS